MKPQDIHEKFEQAFSAGDLDALVGLYEPDAVLNMTDGTILRGQAAIREAYRGLLGMKPTMTIETLHAFESNDGLAMLHGRWSMNGTNPADGSPVQMEGRNTEVVRRQADGSWLFVIDNPVTP
jgi:uncharacterized protein (TIGR02246 family)